VLVATVTAAVLRVLTRLLAASPAPAQPKAPELGATLLVPSQWTAADLQGLGVHAASTSCAWLFGLWEFDSYLNSFQAQAGVPL
jgi:hypothetical protein